MKHILLVLLLCLGQSVAMARFDVHEFDTSEKTERYKTLIAELRCLVCQNQNIADSNADLAKDLRQQIYEMIEAGKTDDEIAEYMVARYGDFVLYRPPVKPMTYLLWAGPFLLLAVGLVVVGMVVRRRRADTVQDIPESQRQRANELLKQQDSNK